MNKKKTLSSKEIGLDIGLRIGRFFLNTEDLHYGYWENGEGANIQNFVAAQEKHSDQIVENIPAGTRRILDVGSGSGNLAQKLTQQGFHVDCVIPSSFLAEQVQKKIGGSGKIHVSKFEAVSSEKKYNLILFSESFQYVKLKLSLEKVLNFLDENGHLLICDFFQKDVPGKSPLGGGHKWVTFEKMISNMPFEKLTDNDISVETAPTIDLMDQFNQEILAPLAHMSGIYLQEKYPRITKLLKWKFKKRMAKIDRIYLSGEVNGENFKKFKTYRLLIFQKIG